jgi:hypothetical protein
MAQNGTPPFIMMVRASVEYITPCTLIMSDVETGCPLASSATEPNI